MSSRILSRSESSKVGHQAGVIEIAPLLSANLYGILRCVATRPEVGYVFVEDIDQAIHR